MKTPAAGLRRGRAGLTLLELLTAAAISLLVTGIAILAYRQALSVRAGAEANLAAWERFDAAARVVARDVAAGRADFFPPATNGAERDGWFGELRLLAPASGPERGGGHGDWRWIRYRAARAPAGPRGADGKRPWRFSLYRAVCRADRPEDGWPGAAGTPDSRWDGGAGWEETELWFEATPPLTDAQTPDRWPGFRVGTGAVFWRAAYHARGDADAPVRVERACPAP